MNLVHQFTTTASKAFALRELAPSNKDIMGLIDLTLLNSNASALDIQTLVENAKLYSAAAVCVLPKHLKLISSELTLKKVTVINFPEGNLTAREAFEESLNIISHYHPDEIDYVFPYSAYLTGQKQYALNCLKEQVQLCKAHQITIKVIVETGAFPEINSIYQLSRELIESGCDFLKTSTGKIPTGATPEACFALLRALIDSKAQCGIKISGGVRSKIQALQYIQLAQYMTKKSVSKDWFRFGASSLLDELV